MHLFESTYPTSLFDHSAGLLARILLLLALLLVAPFLAGCRGTNPPAANSAVASATTSATITLSSDSLANGTSSPATAQTGHRRSNGPLRRPRQRASSLPSPIPMLPAAPSPTGFSTTCPQTPAHCRPACQRRISSLTARTRAATILPKSVTVALARPAAQRIVTSSISSRSTRPSSYMRVPRAPRLKTP
jgi:hypothetical protein